MSISVSKKFRFSVYVECLSRWGFRARPPLWYSGFKEMECLFHIHSCKYSIDLELVPPLWYSGFKEIECFFPGHSCKYSIALFLEDCRSVFSYKLRYIVASGLVEMAISTNPKPLIYRNLYVTSVI